MADYKLTLAEKETIILWSEADDTVQIDTFSQKLINRLRKAKERCPELYRVDEPDRYGGVYAEVPKKLLQISFREPISEERREQHARLAKERFHSEDQAGLLKRKRCGGVTGRPTLIQSMIPPRSSRVREHQKPRYTPHVSSASSASKNATLETIVPSVPCVPALSGTQKMYGFGFIASFAFVLRPPISAAAKASG